MSVEESCTRMCEHEYGATTTSAERYVDGRAHMFTHGRRLSPPFGNVGNIEDCDNFAGFHALHHGRRHPVATLEVTARRVSYLETATVVDGLHQARRLELYKSP